jgi:6-phosphogluconolactonase
MWIGAAGTLAVLGACAGPGGAAGGPGGGGGVLVYVGTRTAGAGKGIEVLRLDTRIGSLTDLGLAAELANPTFLAVNAPRGLLYAVSELPAGPGAVAGYAIEPGSGKLRLINTASSGGNGPCHIGLDAAGRNALVANYGAGSVCVLPLDASGRLGAATALVQHHGSSVVRWRQAGPHAHGVTLDPAGRLALVADLGLDKVVLYNFDPGRGTLTAHDPASAPLAPGTGPRHLAFGPGGRFVYVVGELASSITVFGYDAQAGSLTEVQTRSTLPADFKGVNTAAEVAVHPSGKFLLASNRGHDSMAVFPIDPRSGLLGAPRWFGIGGKTPRHFSIDPTGTWLLAANQDSDNIVVFRFDPESGALTPTGAPVGVAAPTCVVCGPEPAGGAVKEGGQ